MSDGVASALGALAACLFVGLVAWLAWLAVRKVKRGKSFQAAGAALMLFGWGNLRDPRNDTVAEANEGRLRRDEAAGDPPDPPEAHSTARHHQPR